MVDMQESTLEKIKELYRCSVSAVWEMRKSEKMECSNVLFELEKSINELSEYFSSFVWSKDNLVQYKYLQRLLQFQNDSVYEVAIEWLNKNNASFPLETASDIFKNLCTHLLDTCFPEVPSGTEQQLTFSAEELIEKEEKQKPAGFFSGRFDNSV